MSNSKCVSGSKSIFGGVVVFGKIKHPRQETLDLVGVMGIKPHVNDMMPMICSRLDAEDELRWESLRNSHASGSMLYDCMGEDDFLSEEDILSLYGRSNSKRLKKLNKKLYGKGGRSSKKHNKDMVAKYFGYDESEDDYWKYRNTMFSNGEWSDDEDYDLYSGYKSIKFYSDIRNEFSCQEFLSLKEFNDFCDEHGYKIGDIDSENLKSWSVIHCCLDPIDLEYGQYSIITDSSYGGLYWTVSDDLPKDNEESVSSDKKHDVSIIY